MIKLTDLKKYNKEIQKKNQEAVINQNNQNKPKQTTVNPMANSPVKQVTQRATVPFAPVIPKLTGQVAPVVAQPNPLKKELEQVRLKRKKAWDKLLQSRQGNASGVDDPTLKADYEYYFQREKDLEYEIETGIKRGPVGASAYEDGTEILDDTFEGTFRTKDAYEWSRSRDNTRPAYGSIDYFIEYRKDLNNMLEYVQQGIPKMTGVEESGYNSYLADPEALRATDPAMYNHWKNIDNKIKQADAISNEISRVNDILNNGSGNVKYKSVNTDITGDKTYEEYEGNLDGVSAKMTFERAALRGAENNIDKWNKMYENDSNFFEKLTYREFMEMQNDIKNYEETLSRYNASSEKYSDLIYKMKHFEVDSKFGIEKANEDKERYGALSNYYDKEESFRPVAKNGMFEAFRTEEEKQRDRKWDKVNGIMELADDKIDAYTYFEKNKNNEYGGDTLGRIAANVNSGIIGEKIAKTGYNSWEAETDDIEAAKVYQALDERLRNTNKEAYTNYNAWDVYVSTIANYAPQFVNQKVASAKGKVAGAFVGLLFGNPLEGARIGGSVASSVDMFQRTVGSQYVDLLQTGGLSKEDASILATNTALVSGALEFGLSYMSDKLIFGKSKVSSGALVDKLVAGGVSRKGAQIMVNAAKFIGKQAIEGAGEGLEEFLQTGTEIVARKYAENGEVVSSFQLLIDTFDFTSYTKEDYAQMGQAALAGFIIASGSIGTVKGAISSYIDAVETVNTAEFGKQIKKAKLYVDYVADAVTYCKNSTNAEIVEYAKMIEKKLEKGKTLTDEEIGTIIKYSIVAERHNPFEITGGMVEKELKLEQSKSGLVTVYSKDWDVSADTETVKVIEGLAKLSNSQIVIEDLDAVEITDENGNTKYAENMGYVENGIIHINSKNAKTKVGAIVALHEVTHNLENSSMYGAYKDMAFEILYGGEGTEAYNEAYNEIVNKYGDKVSNKDDIDKELVANFTMKNLDEMVINRIVMQNRPLAVKIFNALKAAYNKVKSYVTGTEQDLSDIEKALKIFDKALKERRNSTDNSKLNPFVDEDGNVQFSDNGSGEKRYLLGGESSVVANNKTLAEARRMNLKGKPQSEIFRETGWYKGIDNKWKKEIAPNDAELFKTDKKRYALGDEYTYKALINKKDMPITVLTNQIPIKEDNTADRAKIIQLGYKNARQQNNSNNTGTDTYVYVKDADSNILIGRDALRHGLERNYEATAKVTMQIGDILRDAIKVNELNPREKTAGGYVLLGIGKDSDNNFYPTRVVVNKGKVDDIEVLYAVKAQKKSQSPKGAGSVDDSTPLNKGSIITIADFLNVVKQSYADVLPNDVLEKLNMKRPKSVLADSVKYLLGAEITEETTAPEYNSTAKSRERLTRYENEAVRNIADAMSVSIGDAREIFKPIIKEISTEYMKTGKLSEETVDRLFEEAYKNGRKVNDEAYKEYADLRGYLRNTQIYIDKTDASDIADFGKEIKRYMGRLRVSTQNGTSVDSIYQELNEMHPNLFPDDILASSDRMLKIMEVSDSLRKEETTLDAYYNTDELKSDLKHEFEEAVYKFRDGLWEVKHFNDAIEKAQPSVEIKRSEKEQVAYLKSAYSELSAARKKAEKVMGKLLITEEEKKIAEKVILGVISSEKVKSMNLNTSAINKYIEAYSAVRTLEKEIKKENTKVRAERIEKVTNLLENSDSWKDKKIPLNYAKETQERNIEDITRNLEEAKAVQETIFEPIDDHEAESNRYKNNLIERIDKLKISQKVARGNKHSEAYAIQFLGETQGEIEYIEEKLARYEKGEITDIEEDTKAKGIFDKAIGTRKNVATKEEIESYVDYAYRYAHETNVEHNNLFPKQKAQIIIGKADERLINDLKKEYGIDVSNAFHALNDNDIRHVKNSHGEGTKEKYPITAEDQKQIPDIIENYDDVLYLKRPDGKEGIYYVRRHNGVTYYLESISDKGKILSNKQMIKVSTGTIPDIPGLKDAINKKWNIDSALNDSKVPQMYVQDVWNNDVHTDNVSHKAQNVNSKKSWIEKDKEKLAQLKKDAEIFLDANPKLDYGKIDKCIGEFRNIYNELFEMMNEARIRNGYAPVEYRKNYFPHFIKNKGDSFLNELGKAFGFDLESKFFYSETVTSLPTEILGKTADRKPGIKWLANALHRSEGSITDYDVIDGFAKYITGVCDVIFHTDDIQNVRAFANAIRYKYSDDGVKEKIRTISENNALTDEEKAEQITEKLQKGYKSKLGNYAVNLDKYANVLAGKQVGFFDRFVEDQFGRRTLRAISKISGKVGANMIVGNWKTPAMNFATIPQALKELSPLDLSYGMFQTLKNIKTPDGFDEKSTFLTNRVKVGDAEALKTMRLPNEFLKAMGKPLEYTDALTSGLIWRARYHQNTVKKNMSSKEAIKEADTYTKKLMAGRSYGSMPTIFYSKSGKVITQFMLETNNVISNITKDLYRYSKNESTTKSELIRKVVWRFMKYCIAAELLADLFEKWFGNDGIQSPLGIVFDGIEDFTGFKVPNFYDAIEMMTTEGMIEFEGEKKKNSEALGNLFENVMEDMPFGSIINDGRVPMSAALPDVSELRKLFDSTDEVSNKKKNDIVVNDLIVPLSYIALPGGAGQLKKTAAGVNAYVKGGSYKINNEGKDELQYPIDKNIGNAIKTAVWGKSSTKGARDWVDEGFGSLTAEQTNLYKEMIKGKDTKNTDIYNAINSAGKAKSVSDGDNSKSTDQVVHETLESSKGLTPSQKAKVEISFYSKGEDGNKGKREKAQDLIDFGIAPEKVTKLYYDYDVHDDVSKEAEYEKFFGMTDGRTKKVYEKWGYEPKMSVIKREALANDNSLSPEEKQEVNKALFGDNEAQYDFSSVDNYYYSILTESQQEGYDTYIKNFGENSINTRTFYYVDKVMNSQKDGNGGGRVAKIARLRKIGVPLNQANRIYNVLK